jgi:hypothetical protein
MDAAQLSQLQERSGQEAQVLVWITAKDRITSAPTSLGFWTGDDHRDFVINGLARSYFGAGGIIAVPVIKGSTGLSVRYHTITLPPFLDEVRQVVRTLDPRDAKVELHSQPFDPASGNPIGDPIRMIKGTSVGAPETMEPAPGESELQLEIASSARRLTRRLNLLRSQAALQARAPGDLGREYSDTAAEWEMPWGET